MPYIVWAGVAAFISTAIVFLVAKIFLRSFFEDRPQLFNAIVILVPFAMGLITSQYMRMTDDRALNEAGLTREQYQIVAQKFRSFLNHLSNNSIYEEIEKAGNGELVFDGRDVLWAKASAGAGKLSGDLIMRWAELSAKIAAHLDDEKCGELYFHTISANDFMRAAAQLDSKEFETAIDLMLEQVRASDKQDVQAIPSEIVSGSWARASEKLGSEKSAHLEASVQSAIQGTLNSADACEIIRELWGNARKVIPIDVYLTLVSRSLDATK